jgi:chromate transporter
VFVAITAPWVSKLRASPFASALLDGINVASLALMAAVSYHVARASVIDPWTAAIAIVTTAWLFRPRKR